MKIKLFVAILASTSFQFAFAAPLCGKVTKMEMLKFGQVQLTINSNLVAGNLKGVDYSLIAVAIANNLNICVRLQSGEPYSSDISLLVESVEK